MVVAPSDCMEHLKGTGCSKKTSKLRWNHMFLLPNNFASRIQTLANDNQTLNGGMTRSHQQFTNYKNVLNNEQEVVPYTAALGECGEQEKTEKQTHRILSSHIEWYDHVIAVAFLKCLVSELMRFMGVDGSDMIRRCSHCVSIARSGIRGKFIRTHHFWTAQLRRNMFFWQFPQGNFRNGNLHFFPSLLHVRWIWLWSGWESPGARSKLAATLGRTRLKARTRLIDYTKINKDQQRQHKDAAVASSSSGKFETVIWHDHICGDRNRSGLPQTIRSLIQVWSVWCRFLRLGDGAGLTSDDEWWIVMTRVQSVQRISLSRWVSRDQLTWSQANIPRESAAMIHHDPPTLNWTCWKHIACNLRCCSCRWKRSQMPCLRVQTVLATVDSITGSFFHVEMQNFGDR